MIAPALIAAVLTCGRVAQPNIENLAVLPADGTAAPRSTWIWATADAGTVELRDGQITVDTLEKTVSVTGEVGAATLTILQPRAPLQENKQYSVRVGGAQVSTFTTTAELDNTAPAAPAVAIGAVVGAHFGAYSCGNSSLVTLSVTPTTEVAMVVSAGTTALPETATAAGRGDTVRVIGLAEGDRALAVLAFDLSGNVAASNPVTVTVPRQTSGCTAAPAGPLLLLALVGLARLARRPRQ